MSEDGAALTSLVRNTAVPGTRVGFDFSSIFRRSWIGIESRWVFSDQDRAAARPGPHQHEARRRQQQRHIAAVEHLVEIGDEEGDVDRQERGDQQRSARHSGQRHSFHTTKKASEVVITIVPATAMP